MSKLVEGILDILFPPKCAFCRRRLRPGENGMCEACRASLPYRSPAREKGPDFVEAVCAPLKYEGTVRDALLRYKFDGVTAYARLFGELVPPFSSTKGFTGHALAAAGGIEAVLSALAIGHGLRYGNPGFAEPIPELGLRPVTETESAAVNSVLSNSFGFGGNCSSLIFAK